jgi:hypothetical protein
MLTHLIHAIPDSARISQHAEAGGLLADFPTIVIMSQVITAGLASREPTQEYAGDDLWKALAKR